MVYIINYGIGNLGSVKNMFKKIGVEAQYATTPEDIYKAEKLVLPGVGAFDSCVKALKSSGMLNSLTEQVRTKKVPLLGICVGYQMLTEKSEEGIESGLGWLEAETVKFRDDSLKMKIPHMGWNYITPAAEHPLVRCYAQEKARAYFVHSYYVKAKKNQDVILETEYINKFAAGMAHENIMGVQFHPEKSHRFGQELFKSFMELNI